MARSFAGSSTDINAATINTTSYTNGTSINCTAHDGVHIQVAATFVSSATDDMVVDIFASIDGTNWGTFPIAGTLMSGDNETKYFETVVRDYAYVRTSVKSTGTTDSNTCTAKSNRFTY